MDKSETDPKPSWTASLFLAVLLLLPAIYVGSYFAIVAPNFETRTFYAPADPKLSWAIPFTRTIHYRVGDEWAARIFWPLEQIDRTLFPKRWEPSLIY